MSGQDLSDNTPRPGSGLENGRLKQELVLAGGGRHAVGVGSDAVDLAADADRDERVDNAAGVGLRRAGTAAHKMTAEETDRTGMTRLVDDGAGACADGDQDSHAHAGKASLGASGIQKDAGACQHQLCLLWSCYRPSDGPLVWGLRLGSSRTWMGA